MGSDRKQAAVFLEPLDERPDLFRRRRIEHDSRRLPSRKAGRHRSVGWQGSQGKIVLFEGDGGLLFNIQELETLKRQGIRILICAMNDGGYGSEFHKLRADGLDDSLAVFGRPALENIARGFGLRGHEIRDVSVIPKLFADFAAQGESEMWNIQISDKVTAPVIRQTIKRGHGNM